MTARLIRVSTIPLTVAALFAAATATALGTLLAAGSVVLIVVCRHFQQVVAS